MNKFVIEYAVGDVWFRTHRLFSTEEQAKVEAGFRKEPTRIAMLKEAE